MNDKKTAKLLSAQGPNIRSSALSSQDEDLENAASAPAYHVKVPANTPEILPSKEQAVLTTNIVHEKIALRTDTSVLTETNNLDKLNTGKLNHKKSYGEDQDNGTNKGESKEGFTLKQVGASFFSVSKFPEKKLGAEQPTSTAVMPTSAGINTSATHNLESSEPVELDAIKLEEEKLEESFLRLVDKIQNKTDNYHRDSIEDDTENYEDIDDSSIESDINDNNSFDWDLNLRYDDDNEEKQLLEKDPIYHVSDYVQLYNSLLDKDMRMKIEKFNREYNNGNGGDIGIDLWMGTCSDEE